MKAIVQETYGTFRDLRLAEVEKPVPADDEVLIEVRASSVNYGNLALLRGEPFLARFWSGLFRPKHKIPGGDVAGRVAAVGSRVKRFRPGDEVFGDLCTNGFGAFAEYARAPEWAVARKPAGISFEEAAAAAQAAVVALQGLRDKMCLQPGQSVLIYGSTGGIGTFAVQIAKAYGATVTAVCSTGNVELVRSLGADHVIDRTREDFARQGRRYDLILATAGYRPIFDYRRALSPGGTVVVTGGSLGQIFQAMLLGPWISRVGSKRLGHVYHRPNPEDLSILAELMDQGKIKSVIDRNYPLSEAAQALAYYAEGHTRGKIVITV